MNNNNNTLRKYFTHIYYNTNIGRIFIHPFIALRDKLIPEKLALRIRFKRMLGYSLNLKAPKTFKTYGNQTHQTH